MTLNLKGYLGPGRTQEKCFYNLYKQIISKTPDYIPPSRGSSKVYPSTRDLSHSWREEGYKKIVLSETLSSDILLERPQALLVLLLASLLPFILPFQPLGLVTVFFQVYFPRPRTNRRVDKISQGSSQE